MAVEIGTDAPYAVCAAEFCCWDRHGSNSSEPVAPSPAPNCSLGPLDTRVNNKKI